MGGVGVTGGMAANQLAPQGFSDWRGDTSYRFYHRLQGALFPPGRRVLLLNVAEFDALKLDATALIADARAGLQALTHSLREYRSGWGEEIAQAKPLARRVPPSLGSPVAPDEAPEVAGHLDAQLTEYGETLNTRLTQTRVLGLINQHVEDNAIVVGAAGSLPGDLQRLWQVKTPDTYHLEYGYSCMGYEIAAALGAKLARPGQPVYAMVGMALT